MERFDRIPLKQESESAQSEEEKIVEISSETGSSVCDVKENASSRVSKAPNEYAREADLLNDQTTTRPFTPAANASRPWTTAGRNENQSKSIEFSNDLPSDDESSVEQRS